MLDVPSYILGKKSGGGSGGTSNYNELSNKPSINDVTLSGNKTTADLGITIPTKTSDLTNDGDGSGLFSLTNYAKTNVDGSGIYFGNSNDVNLRKKIDDTHYLDYPVETTTNKVTSISSSSTDTEYPSAKAVYDILQKFSFLSAQNQAGYDFTLGTTHDYVQMPLTLISQGNGNVFSISNNTITINKKITNLLISVSIPLNVESGIAESKFIRIEKFHNGVSQGDIGFTETYCTASKTTTIIIPMSLTNAEIGDTFKVYIYGQSSDKIYRNIARVQMFALYKE